MAKVDKVVTSKSHDRASIELQIGLNNRKWYESPVTSLISAPSVLCDYYRINKNETTFTETLNMTQSHSKTNRFDKISNFVMYGRGSESLEDKPDAEKRLSINLANQQSIIVGVAFVPIEGDHIILHGNTVKKPYMVEKVTPLKLIDREVWQIDYRETERFTASELEERVVNRFNFDSGAIGSGLNPIVPSDLSDKRDKCEEAIKSLNKSFIDTFYDIEHDVLGFSPSFGSASGAGIEISNTQYAELFNKTKYIFNHYVNPFMQDKHRILKYGFDRNDLMLSNIYKFDREEVNYKTSLYQKLLKRQFKKMGEVIINGTEDLITDDSSVLLDVSEAIKDIIHRDDGYDYIPKYDYSIKFYLRRRSNHLILTTLFNSGIILVDMMNTASFVDPELRSHYVTYRLTSPRICEFLDMWMDNDIDGIISNIDKLDDILIDKDNIDDYIGIPLLMIVVEESLNSINKDIKSKTYS